MARKPTDKQLFKMKNEWLGQFYEEVKPKDFYRAVFPEGSFEREGHPEDEKCNGVLTVIEGEKARNYIVFDELNMIDEVKGAEFAIMSPVGYSGRNRTAKNARWLYGIAVDLDGVEMEQLRDVFHQMKHDFLPQCTYCVNYLRPAICRCSRRLHLPRQRVRKTKIYSWWHTPFLYLYRGGSVAHYTIVAEMPQEAISPCLLSKP